ncbi:cation channel sperm-associated targeting subunit tau [Elephas maximus indicus]|uniref:cation channel sperm-associated targeting subunit tau n=1 Tax=Elephas maximus indicus TaxID=99487 RepID=UPI00211703D4|nr:cation channel sperm-associated targeting subunit tau [Elephas maximus indicus]
MPPKAEAKEGPGHRLLKMLRKTLKEPENKELEVAPEMPTLVPFGDVVGCLAIHIKNCRYFTPKIILKPYYTNLFIRITINNVVKCTKMYTLLSKGNEKNIIKFDEVKYFSVQVPRRPDDARNNIYLELMEYEDTEKYPVFLGSVQVHLYEVIQKGCFTEEFQILNKNTFVCRVQVEFMFSYGNFGFGFSHQLKPLQKIIEPSMFMNIAPPPERTDPVSNVIVPQPVEYPAFLSPDLNVTVGKPSKASSKSNQSSVVRLEKLQQPPRERLEKMKKEYRNLSTWIEKANYLGNILTPALEHKDTERSNTSDVLGSLTNDQLKEKTQTSDAPLINGEVETVPKKLLDNKTLPTLTLPTLKLLRQDDLNAIPAKSDESEKQTYPPPTDPPLFTIPTIEEKKIPSSDEHQFSPPEVKLENRYPSPVKTDSSPPEVFFSPEQLTSPSLRPRHIESNTQYQFQTFNIKDGFDPFLRNINNKMSVRKRKDQDMPKCRNILSAEVIEHEDQDPPYPAHSEKTAEPTNKIWACYPDITIKPLDTKLKGRPPNVTLPNFEGESSMTANVDTCHLSKSLNLSSHVENLKQSMLLKSILSKNLQDRLDELFSKPEVPMDIEARKKSHRSQFLSVHDKPTSSLEDKVSEKSQDLKSWLPEKDILNSKSLLSQIIKDMPTDSLSEGGSGKSTEVEREHSSAKDLKAGVPDYVIKQIFTSAIFSETEKGVKVPGGTKLNVHDQLPTAWERSLPSHNGAQYEKKDNDQELSESKSAINRIMQAFPVDALLESGLIKVTELDKEHQESSLGDSEKGSPDEKPNYSTKEYSKIKTEPLSEQNIPSIPKEATCALNTIESVEEGQNIPPQDSKHHSISDIKTDLPRNGQRLYKEENDLNNTLENLSNLLMDKLSESDTIILKSFLKCILNVFFKYGQSERRQPERELQRLIQHSFTNDTEDPEEIRENFDKVDKLDRKPILNPKLHVFLEELSESEIKNFKAELSKHIQHYLVERLAESGHITEDDLPKIHQNLYLLNEKSEPRGQDIFREKYSETVKEIMSFIHNFHHHFIDKHLEIKLCSFLSEILQNYFLENLSESKLFKETEPVSILSSTSSLRAKSASISLQDSGQDISRGSFGRRLEINTKFPLNKSLQNYLTALSENELLNLKADLSKHLRSFFFEKLSKSGLTTKRQLEKIDQHINLINSSSTPLKCIKTDWPFRDESKLIEEHSEKQTKYSNIAQKNTLQKVPEGRLVETELIRKEEKEYFPLHNLEENLSIIREQKRYYSKEGAKTLSLIKVHSSSNKNVPEIPLNKSPERLTNITFKNQRKEHDFIQFPRAENSICKAETQDLYSWGGKSKIIQSNTCFERTLNMMSLEKKEHVNIYKLTSEEKPEAGLSPYPRVPNCKMPDEDEYSNRLTFPSRQSHTLTQFNSEAGETSKLEDRYCQRLKGNNNNKKQHSVTFAEYKNEMQTHYKKTAEICSEKCANVLESQSFQYNVLEVDKFSKLSLFPEVLKRDSLKPKIRKERDHAGKQKKSFSKIVKILPTTLPPAKIHLKKSIPRTLLHWTARTTTHDCSDKFEDLPVASFKPLEKTKSRTRLLGKRPADSPNQSKHSARPHTAPGVNKRQEGCNGKLESPRLVSAGLVHISDTISNHEKRKARQKNQLKENVEKCSLICDIIQMLNTSE